MMKKTNKKQQNFNIYIVAFSKTRKIKKTPRDIIILNLCTKNPDNMGYSS